MYTCTVVTLILLLLWIGTTKSGCYRDRGDLLAQVKVHAIDSIRHLAVIVLIQVIRLSAYTVTVIYRFHCTRLLLYVVNVIIIATSDAYYLKPLLIACTNFRDLTSIVI